MDKIVMTIGYDLLVVLEYGLFFGFKFMDELLLIEKL